MRHSTLADPGAGLIGRGPEMARLRRLLLTPGQLLLITGERGAGKSRLLAAGLQLARRTGRHRVLTLHGSGLSAPDLIRHLLLAVRHDLPALPASLGRPALAALGLDTGPAAGPVALRSTLDTVLAGIAPVLIAADDAHLFTPDAAALLAELAGVGPVPPAPDTRAAQPPVGVRTGQPAGGVTLLAAGPTGRLPVALAGLPALELRPLSPADAARLLAAQPGPLPGRTRAEILRRAAGNPAALIELAGDTASGSLLSAFAAEADRLPADTRRLLVHLAAASGPGAATTTADPAAVPAASDLAAITAAADPGPVPAASDPAAITATTGPGPVPAASDPAAITATTGPGPVPAASDPAAITATTGPGPVPAASDPAATTATTGPAAASAAVTADPAWGPAELAGLITRIDGAVAFTHPLVGEAVYRGTPAHLRRQAHQALAAALPAAPEKRAWHLAAATPGRDETIAAGLEAAAAIHRYRGALFEATAAMERAADRSPLPAAAARRLTQAVADARDLGEAGWAVELHAAVRRLTGDPDLITAAACAAARALSRVGRQHEAYGLLAAARRAGPPTGPRAALTVAALAATIAGISGHPEHQRGLPPLLTAAGPDPDEVLATFVRVIGDPAAHPGRALCAATTAPPPGAAPAERYRLNMIGTIAWYEDRSRLAAELMGDIAVVGRVFPPGVEVLPVLVTALMDTGDWSAAERQADVRLPGLPLIGANLAALRAQLYALRGDTVQAAHLAHETWQQLDVGENRSTHVRLLRAASLAAVNSGDYENGYRHLRSMFDADGRPLHSFLAGRSIAELAAAAARNGRRADARTVLARVRDKAGAEPSSRMRLLLHLSEALLDESEQAEHHFRLATVDPAGHEWPYERALARLHYGEWLRRARRPRDARPLLSAASAAFTELGAVTAAELADRELRASGRPAGSRLDVLTPQERQVAQLAARGLRNREIAEQLFISVRTVGAHLYSAYPKLGITGRHQLHDAVTRG